MKSNNSILNFSNFEIRKEEIRMIEEAEEK